MNRATIVLCAGLLAAGAASAVQVVVGAQSTQTNYPYCGS